MMEEKRKKKKNKKLLKRSTLYVARLNKEYGLMMSKPCKICTDIMKSFGVKEVCYSDANGNWITQQVYDL